MRKKIDVMLCICFLLGTVLGCGEEGNLIGDSNTAAFEGSSQPEMADAAEAGTEQEPTEVQRTEQLAESQGTGQQQVEQAEPEEGTTPVQRQEITVDKEAYLLTEVPELWDIAHCIHQKTSGQAFLRVDMIWEPDYQVMYQGRVLPRYYDYLYASVVWPDHEENVI